MLHAATPRAVPRLRPWSRLALIGACLLATAHAGPSTPASSAQVSLADVDAITIMPVAFPAGPMLIERDEPLTALYGEFDDYIYGALLRKLALKGYVLDRARNWQRPADRLNAGPWQLDTLGGDRYAGQMASVPVCDGPPPRSRGRACSSVRQCGTGGVRGVAADLSHFVALSVACHSVAPVPCISVPAGILIGQIVSDLERSRSRGATRDRPWEPVVAAVRRI